MQVNKIGWCGCGMTRWQFQVGYLRPKWISSQIWMTRKDYPWQKGRGEAEYQGWQTSNMMTLRLVWLPFCFLNRPQVGGQRLRRKAEGIRWVWRRRQDQIMGLYSLAREFAFNFKCNRTHLRTLCLEVMGLDLNVLNVV